MTSDCEQAVQLAKAGQLSAARAIAAAALKKNPNHPDILHFLGRIDLQEGKLPSAVDRLKQAVDLAPVKGEYHLSLAEACRASRDLLRAEWESQLALRFDAERPQALNVQGLVYRDGRRYQDAVRIFSEAIKEKVANSDAMNNLATVFLRMGEYRMAEKYLHLVLKMDSRHSRAWNNLGLALRAQRRLAEAKEAFGKADGYPPARFNLAYVLLLEDNLREGLPLYEARKAMLGLGKGIAKPEWDGTPQRQKTLLVVAEQGLGDAILTSRFYPLLTRHFKKVFVQTSPALLRLMGSIDREVEFIPEDARVPFDLWCPSLSLPLLLKIDTIDKIPQEPWFRLPNTRPAGGALRIGLNWAGNPAYLFDGVRSASLKDLELLLQVPGVTWYSLHKGVREEEAQRYGLAEPLKGSEDFLDTALFLKSLDMVISTETAVPNLSAALGIPTCVLTSPDYDWRWGSWYASAVVCPQDNPGNWFGAIAKAMTVIGEHLTGASREAAGRQVSPTANSLGS